MAHLRVPGNAGDVDHPLSPDLSQSLATRPKGYFDDLTSVAAANKSAPPTNEVRNESAVRPPLSPRTTARPASAPAGKHEDATSARPPLFAGLSDATEPTNHPREFLLSLRAPPHRLPITELEQRLRALQPGVQDAPNLRPRSASISSSMIQDTLPVELVSALLTTLSAELERCQQDLAKSHRMRAAQVEALKDIIKRDAMGVSEASVERALLRAASAADESPHRKSHTSPSRWDMVIEQPIRVTDVDNDTRPVETEKTDALHHDLEEAMSDMNLTRLTTNAPADTNHTSPHPHSDSKHRHAFGTARLFAGIGATRPMSPMSPKVPKEADMCALPSSAPLTDPSLSVDVHGKKRSRSDSAVSAADSYRSSMSSRSQTAQKVPPTGISGWASGILGWGSGKRAVQHSPAPDVFEGDRTSETGVPEAAGPQSEPRPVRSASESTLASTAYLSNSQPTTLPTSVVDSSPSQKSLPAKESLHPPSELIKAPNAVVTAVLTKRQVDSPSVSSAHASPVAHPVPLVSPSRIPPISAGSKTGSLPVDHPTHFIAVTHAAQRWTISGSNEDISEALLREPSSVSPAIRRDTVRLMSSLSHQADHVAAPGAIEPDVLWEGQQEGPVAASMSRAGSSSSIGRSPSPAPARQPGYLKSAKGHLGRALGLVQPSSRRPPAKRSEPSLTVPGIATDRQNPVFQSLVLPPMKATSSASSTSAVVELDTIVKSNDKPPTFSDFQADFETGELAFDRYGFVIDMKSGMQSLRALKQRSQQRAAAPDEPTEQAVRQGAGPPKSSVPGDHKPSVAHRGALPVTVADPAPQSVKRLAAQLAEINERLERAQRDAWDTFLQKRRAKIVESSAAKYVAANSSSAALALGAALAGTDSATTDDQVWSENRIGIARLGRGDKDDWRTFKNLVRSSIPIAYRPAIWAEMSGAYELREPGYYQELVQKHEADTGSPCLKQIEADVGRTFGSNIFFGGDGPGIPKLRRILAAFSWHCPEIGYCQGMNMVAGTLLLTFPGEEDAFWMLTAIIERMLPSDYYTPTLLVSRADQRVLRDLCPRVLPNIKAHFDKHSMELEVVTFGWFLSLYSNVLPIQTLLRVWDILFCDGVIVLFRVAFAMIRMHEEDILNCDSATAIYVYLRNMPMQLVQADRLIKVACNDFRSIKTKDIIALRERHVAEMQSTETYDHL